MSAIFWVIWATPAFGGFQSPSFSSIGFIGSAQKAEVTPPSNTINNGTNNDFLNMFCSSSLNVFVIKFVAVLRLTVSVI
jgi:hypothetical protein